MTLFADETYAQLAPLEDEDARNGYALRALVRANASMFAQPEEAIRALGDGKAAWERVFDADRAPLWLLPFVGQAVGVLVDTSASEEEQRLQIKAEGAWHRGKPSAIEAAVKRTLYPAINFVPTPSFEYGTGAWSSTGGLLTSGATIARTTSQAQVGSASLEVVTGATAGRGAQLLIPGTFYSGVWYTASVYLKGNAGGEELKVWFGGSGGFAEAVQKTVTLTTSWQRVTVAWKPPSTHTNVAIAIANVPASNYTFFADAAMVNGGSSALTYFDGDSDSEHAWLGAKGESKSVSTAPGGRVVRMVERATTAWNLLIVTRSAETADVTATREAAAAATPGGIVPTVEVSDLPLIDEMTREIDLMTTDTIDTLTLEDVT